MKQHITALIPARLQATRFPGKLLKKLHGKSIIQRTYLAVQESNLYDSVIVVCDDISLIHEIKECGGNAVMSKREHESGTDRIAEIAADLETDIIVNVQGDEPFIPAGGMQQVIRLFENSGVQVASLMLKITDPEQIQNPNCVKVITDNEGRALYFSRSPIPYFRDQNFTPYAFQHIGVYGFRKEALMNFTRLPVSNLEQIEKLENLRLLENGIPVHLAETDHIGISIDTEADFYKAEEYLRTLSEK